MKAVNNKVSGSIVNVLALLVLLGASFLLLHQLGAHSIFIWDEAIYANNAIEMAQNGDWWVIKNNGAPSHYNVKPPLVIWLQALFIKIMGPTEWAIRLPSALAGIGVFLISFRFSKKWTGSYLAAIFSILILCWTIGFNRGHVVRTGDLDGVNLFFTFWYAILFIDYLWNEKTHKHFAWKLMMVVLLAFLSKSLAGLMPVFPLFMLAIFHPKGRQFLMEVKTWAVILVGLLLIVSYYVFRDLAQPGYFALVWQSEFLRFTHEVMSWHLQPFSFYVENMLFKKYFFPGILLLIFPVLVLFQPSSPLQKLVIQTFLTGLIFLIFISIPSVKLLWYDAFIYPCWTLSIGLSLYYIHIQKVRFLGLNSVKIIVATLFIIIFILSGRTLLQHRAEVANYTDPLEVTGEMIRHLTNERPTDKDYTVLMQTEWLEHLDQAMFYLKQQNWFYDANLEIISPDLKNLKWMDKLTPNQKVLCCQSKYYDLIFENFEVLHLNDKGNCKYFEIIRRINE